MPTNKSLGQHWLTDRSVLASIAEAAELTKADTVLEIGPGLGTLTSELLRRAGTVVAVEFDEQLAAKLPGQFPGTALSVVHQDILQYNLASLPAGYKVVANVPYYITSKIIQKLLTAPHKPALAVLLVQKEVAERIAAGPGDFSILGISAQLYATVHLGHAVPRQFFTPPPKVDSQVVILRTRPTPLIAAADEKALFRIVKIGFAARRKKLRSSIAAGLGIKKHEAENLLRSASINPALRAQDLAIDEWLNLAKSMSTH
ncbi:MAG: 16S rRNA (adenine(1518)-N(6)/adenine(1519)-N(6))-dimethyltransferase RsmA [Candidatus Saccharimonas sp.]